MLNSDFEIIIWMFMNIVCNKNRDKIWCYYMYFFQVLRRALVHAMRKKTALSQKTILHHAILRFTEKQWHRNESRLEFLTWIVLTGLGSFSLGLKVFCGCGEPEFWSYFNDNKFGEKWLNHLIYQDILIKWQMKQIFLYVSVLWQ